MKTIKVDLNIIFEHNSQGHLVNVPILISWSLASFYASLFKPFLALCAHPASNRLRWCKPKGTIWSWPWYWHKKQLFFLLWPLSWAVMLCYFDKVKVHCGRSLNKQELDSYPISRKNCEQQALSDLIKIKGCWTLNKLLSVNPHLALRTSGLELVLWITGWWEGLQPVQGHVVDFMASLLEISGAVILEGQSDAI